MAGFSRSHLKLFVSMLSLLPLAGVSGDGATAAPTATGHGDAASCQAMAYRTIAPHTVITAAEFELGGGMVGGTKLDVPFCRIAGVATPTDDSHIGFEVWLPPAKTWNGKLLGVGSGASAGSISTGALAAALAADYAGVATDNGHVTDASQKNGANEQTWALGHPQKLLDFAYRAMHVSTVAAKQVARAFYGRGLEESYFFGCSQGGHHALMEASRYPDDYDGIIAGAPAWHWANQMVNAVWNSQPIMKDPTALTAQSAALLNSAVVKACDRLDGLEDGLISDPRRCNFDPVSIQCTQGSEPGQCLTPVQVAAARRLYAGATKSDGTRIFQGLPRGSEANWAAVWGNATPGGSSFDFWRYSVFQDRDFKNIDFDFDRDTDRGLGTKVGSETIADIYNVKPDLSRFRAHGGKLIMYHGWADQQVTPYGSLDFYQHIVAKEDQAGTDGFLRLFMMPGIGHCAGGPGMGIGYSGGVAAPGLIHDTRHDVLMALDAWVRHKQVPGVLIGTHLDAAQKPDRTRPLCPYPREARYKGAGDINDAASFVCAAAPGPKPNSPL